MSRDAFNLLSGEVRQLDFFTAYDRPLKVEIAPMSAETLTEQAYVPPEVLISDMVAAGQRLDAARRARFDSDVFSEGPVEDMPLDVTREPGVGIEEVLRAGRAAMGRIDAARRKDDEAKAEVSEEPEVPVEARKAPKVVPPKAE